MADERRSEFLECSHRIVGKPDRAQSSDTVEAERERPRRGFSCDATESENARSALARRSG
jgi:hypothetical protein